MDKTFQQLLKNEIFEKKIFTGALIKGIVTEISNKHVTVDAGLKSDSLINISEFLDKNNKLEVSINDAVDVLIENIDNENGYTQLSREKVKLINSWKILENAYINNLVVEGKIINRVKGGFVVETEAIKSFLPGSLADTKPIRDYEKLEGKIFNFKILKINKKNNNIVLSRKAALEETTNTDKKIVVSNLHENQNVSGIVKNITDYGAFVDLGGIDGLLHITDMSWGRVKHPNNIIKIGEYVDVKILKYDQKKNRVSLGLKQLKQDPWFDVNEKYKKNKKLTGVVTNVIDYGCFVELEPGVEGLIHVSEMGWLQKSDTAKNLVKLNEKIEVVVLSVDEKKRRISLGLKERLKNPWELYNKQNLKGNIVKGLVKSVTTFGVFVELNENISGLIHLNDITWSETPTKIMKTFKKGDSIEAVLLYIDPTRERISLGLKQLTKNPLTTFFETYKIGTKVSGIVKKTNTKNTIVKLDEDIEGLVDTTELKQHELQIGTTIEAIITGQDYKSRYVTLSTLHKKEKENLEKQYKNTKFKNTLGEIIKNKVSC